MKRLTSLVLLLFLLPLSSCSRSYDARELMEQFLLLYGAQGVIYCSDSAEWEEGYLPPETLRKIYACDYIPESYAILLNSRAEYGSECAFFVLSDLSQRAEAEQTCLERIRTLRGGENSFVVSSGRVVFYSTLRESERAMEIFKKIIK